MIDKWLKTLLAIVALLFILMLGNPPVWAENPWGMGIDLGFLADTVDDTMLTMSFQGDYYLDSKFSIGPQLLLSAGDNLTQLTVAGVARYHIPLGAVSVILCRAKSNFPRLCMANSSSCGYWRCKTIPFTIRRPPSSDGHPAPRPTLTIVAKLVV